VLCGVFLEKFGGDSMDEISESYKRYMERIREY
jgi:hypothetical protein